MSVNKAILVGRLGKDPETRYTAAGQAVCNFSVATDESWKARSGEKQRRTEWHRIVAWGKLAEIIQQYCKKGMQVYIEGRIQSRQWDDREGIKRYTTEIVASVLRMLGSKGDNGRADDPPVQDDEHDEQGQGGHSPQPESSDTADEDIPF